MADLIYRETARRIIDSPRSREQMLTVLRCTPSVQPERKTGKWLMNGEKCGELIWRCSECNVEEIVPTLTSFISGITYPQWSFCPNCGADMRGEQNDR